MCSPWATLADLPRSKDTPSNGEPWHLPCPRNAARKGTDGTSRPPSVLAPGSLRADRRHWAVGGWWLALCRRALGATWSRGGGRWVARRFVRSSSSRSFFLSFFRTSCISFARSRGSSLRVLCMARVGLSTWDRWFRRPAAPAFCLDRWHRQLNGRRPTFFPCLSPALLSQVGMLVAVGLRSPGVWLPALWGIG